MSRNSPAGNVVWAGLMEGGWQKVREEITTIIIAAMSHTHRMPGMDYFI